MERMESTTNDQMAAWLASGGADSAKTIIAIDDQGVELHAAMLTRSPQTCYSIGRDDNGLSAAAMTAAGGPAHCSI